MAHKVSNDSVVALCTNNCTVNNNNNNVRRVDRL